MISLVGLVGSGRILNKTSKHMDYREERKTESQVTQRFLTNLKVKNCYKLRWQKMMGQAWDQYQEFSFKCVEF